jgi:acetyltransferase-like isoleucine patch superfamily enzyme
MNEMEKAAAGLLYDTNNDLELIRQRQKAKALLYEYNHLSPQDDEDQRRLLQTLLGKTGEKFIIEAPFHCDYGYNIELGENFYANVNLVILDCARVTLGSNVFIGPNVGLYTAGHPLDVERRNQGLEYALPIIIGDNVWIGGGVTILPGVTVGEGSVIGAGSVVTKSVPANVVAVGNPCHIVREIGEADRQAFRPSDVPGAPTYV